MMPRPSRSSQALEILRSYYQKNGILPSFEVITELMGYRSPGSTYPVIKALIKEGYLEQDERGGRLKPGQLFGTPQHLNSPQTQLLTVPVGCKTITVTRASIPELAVLPGDTLVYDLNAMPVAGDVLAVQLGQDVVAQPHVLGDGPPLGLLGVVVLQYRRYSS